MNLLRWGSAVALLLPALSVARAAPAPTDDAAVKAPPSPPEEPPWPYDGSPARHSFIAAVGFGSCWRHDANVGGGGACGDIDLGMDFALGKAWRFGFEVGLGFLGPNTVGDSSVGVAMSSGGAPYVVARLMGGVDFTRLFFGRLGFQTRSTFVFGRADLGPQAFLDVGTRVLNHLEVGLRAYVGGDGVINDNANSTSESLVLGYGTGLLLRWVVCR